MLGFWERDIVWRKFNTLDLGPALSLGFWLENLYIYMMDGSPIIIYVLGWIMIYVVRVHP